MPSTCIHVFANGSLFFSIVYICIGTSQVAPVVKNLPANAGDIGDSGLIPGWEDTLVEGMATLSNVLPGEFHGQESLVGYSLLGHKESDTTEAT